MTTALTPTPLPASPSDAVAEESHSGHTRPLGAAYATTIPNTPPMTGLRYDPQRQITVTADGRPLAEQPLTAATTTPTDTRYDNQWEVDHTPVD